MKNPKRKKKGEESRGISEARKWTARIKCLTTGNERMSGSYASTMGFAPVVDSYCVWHTQSGYRHFMGMVKSRLNARFPDGNPVVEDTNELLSVYRRAVGIMTDFGHPIQDPPKEIHEAADYASLMLENRVRMRHRLADMKLQCASGATNQPRGSDENDRGELFHKETRNYAGAYSAFLEHQNSLRKRFQ